MSSRHIPRPYPRPQPRLDFLPVSQGQGSSRPTLCPALTGACFWRISSPSEPTLGRTWATIHPVVHWP